MSRPLQMLPVNTNIREAYSHGQDSEQKFIQNLSVFLSVFLREHGSLVEKKAPETLDRVRLRLLIGCL